MHDALANPMRRSRATRHAVRTHPAHRGQGRAGRLIELPFTKVRIGAAS